MTRTQGNNESYIESLHQEIFALQQQVLVLQPLQIEVEQLRQQVFTLRQQRLITSSGQSSSRQEFSLAERQARRDSYTNIGHFITETPDHAKPAKEKEKHPLNWAKAKPFMDNVPRNEDDWVVKRAQLGLDGSDGIIQLVDELTLRTMRPCPQTDDTDSAFTFSLGLYGETAASMLLEADRSVKTSRYRLLVFLALCCVSLEVGQPKEEVNRTMQQVLARLNGSRTASDRMFSRYLRAVKWVVSRADELFYRLEHRAFELFLHGGAALSLWVQLSSDERYAEQFGARIPRSSPREEQQASLMLAIPFLAWAVSGYSFPIVCKALGTNLFGEADAQSWLQTYTAKKTHICRAPKQTDPPSIKRNRKGRKPRNRTRSRLPNNSHGQQNSAINFSYPPPTHNLEIGNITPQGPEASLSVRFHRPSETLFHRYPVRLPYESHVFVSVQNGDVLAIRALCQTSPAIIDAVDPYGLGLLYYGTYYCWRNCGMRAALETCRALVANGADLAWVDEMTNAPIETMIDAKLVESAMEHDSGDLTPALGDIQEIFQASPSFWHDYRESRGFTLLHEVLLRLNSNYPSLESLLGNEILAPTLIDNKDNHGRSALHWAVVHAWTDAAERLIGFGANVNQRISTALGETTLLHLALAGPIQSSSKFLAMVDMLICAGADVNAADHEGWTPLHVAASWNSSAAIAQLQQSAGRNGQIINWAAITFTGESAEAMAQANGSTLGLLRL